MKKFLLSTILLITGLSNVNAQEGHFKIGAHVGRPIENHSLDLGIDVAYLWKLNNKTELGVTTGFSNYFGRTLSSDRMLFNDEIKIKSAQIIPLAGTVKFNVTNRFFIGADLGYAFIFSNKDNEGALYYQPKLGFDFNQVELYLSYKGATIDGHGIDAINLGIAYNF